MYKVKPRYLYRRFLLRKNDVPVVHKSRMNDVPFVHKSRMNDVPVVHKARMNEVLVVHKSRMNDVLVVKLANKIFLSTNYSVTILRTIGG